ncbi:MAG: hypothetical protein RR825_07610, partial [Ruthenibacterium sp.]
DETTTLEHTAPASFLRAALSLAAHGLTSEGVLRLLKTGLCGFAADDVAALENYAYTWQLCSEDWRAPFTKNPSGFGPAGDALTEEDVTILTASERVRAAAVPKLDAFLRAMHGTGRGAKAVSAAARADGSAASSADAANEPLKNGRTAGEISHALYALLQAFDGDAHTAQLAETLGLGEDGGGEAVYRTWNTMMTLLDQMNALLGGDYITAQEYDDLLVLLLRASDIGHVPQTQNVVILTTADRMRLQNPKYCFVLGVSEGAFPKAVGYSGLLTHTDREHLVQSGVDMPGSYENRMLLEQMFFYRALTAPSQGLYLSAVKPEAGAPPLTSALTVLLDALTPPPLFLSLAEKAPTPAAALDLLGAQYREDTPETAALAAALESDAAAADSLRAMERAAVPPPFAARDTAA